MEHKVRVIEPDDLMDQLPQLLSQAESIPLIISGNSMSPFLIHGRDTVYLSKVTKPPKRGDIVLFRRKSGAYILHRIYAEHNGVYDLVGDGQLGIEPGICMDQIMAEVNTVRRKGRLLRKGDICWLFYEKIWLGLLPVRPWIHRVYFRMKAWRNDK